AALMDPVPGRTLAGLATTPLPPDARRARIEPAFLPRTLVAGRPAGGAVRVVNTSAAAWPGLAADDDGLVMVRAAWEGLPGEATRLRLPRDLAAGESVTLRFPLVPPGPPADYRIRFWLEQAPDDRFPEDTAPPLVTTISVTSPAAGG